ncbi:polysaccharide biosynthesis protein [Oribacterium sp. C9]|uniref:polysaccharide biosynthesis protein n=1 Tax=Oribacterium sp. C9 TaxID=1943579 RepID=UPI00098F70AF
MRIKRKLEHWQIMTLCVGICDLISIHCSYFLALWLRFDAVYSRIPLRYLRAFYGFITPYAIGCVILFNLCRLYRILWRFASVNDLARTGIVSFIASVLHAIIICALFIRMPLSYLFGGALFQLFLLCVPRFFYRGWLLFCSCRKVSEASAHVMVIGAGNAGQMIIRDIKSSDKLTDNVVCVIDDDPDKWNRYIYGVRIVGGREEIFSAVEKYKVDKIYLAIPSLNSEDRKEILGICNETGCELKQLPGYYQLMSGQVTVSAMKDVAVEDLLGREVIQPEMKEVFDFISGKVVLVTGGGGSIGSELCRQVAAHGAKQLIIFDIYENNAYDIQNELKEKHPELDLVTLIGSVRDSRRIWQVFDTYHPQIVYHAAAHKHVPLMEDSPCESIKNNAIGTYKTAYAAMAHGCERFVLISTDKAVNPTNIMGASKRLCEMIIQTFDKKVKEGRIQDLPQLFTHGDGTSGNGNRVEVGKPKTEFVAVRFGNVLGSNGSVIPIFKKQIAKGGPVTVTDPDIIRYFMTIPEAVRLVMLAGTYAHGGEIFVLDMGSPVKIDTLARNLIRLSGFKPDEDIKIVYTGLRPGEKLYEEKLMAEEGLKKTDNALIHIGQPIPFDYEVFIRQLEGLMEAAYKNKKNIREWVAKIVNTYHPALPKATMVKNGAYEALTEGSYKSAG